MEVDESKLGEERAADKPLGARQPTRTPRGITRLQKHQFPPSFFVLLAPVTYLMIHKKRIRISECLCLRYSTFARLRQVRLPIFLQEGMGRGVDLAEKKDFLHYKTRKKN